MEEVVKATTATVKQKMTPEQEAAQIAVAKLDREAEDASVKAAVTGETGAATEGEVLPKELTLNIKVSDFARIVSEASTGRPVRPYQLNAPSDSVTERILDNTLGAVGDGLHRVADGARDIVGGLIDIVTLGRAGRR